METSWEIETVTPVDQRRGLPMQSAGGMRALRPTGAFQRQREWTGPSLPFSLLSRSGLKNVAPDRLRDELEGSGKLTEMHRFPLVHVLDADREGRDRRCAQSRGAGPNSHHVGVI